MAVEDQVFLSEGGVVVTRARLTSPLRPTFQTRSVSAVDLRWEKNPRFGIGLVLCIIGGIVALGGIALVGDAIGFLVGLVGVLMVAGPIVFRQYFFHRYYLVVITTTSDPMRFYYTQDQEFATRIRDAINEAWAAAG